MYPNVCIQDPDKIKSPEEFLKEVLNDRTPETVMSTVSFKQSMALEEEFQRNEKIPRLRRAILSDELGMTERKIKFWFRARRSRERMSEVMSELSEEWYRRYVLKE
ncbi:Homeobox protein rough [Thelohanellus kitauei]|uniref:Homeobox protein rough n=1 Tax=Thelohanellus kitauei TaxID=669202 RepID=A0A0C2N4S4_THEKT|nr:Homeobox protein rough [Thelohanellus kitauei]